MRTGISRGRTQFIRLGFIGLLSAVVVHIASIQDSNSHLQKVLKKMESSQWLAREVIRPERGTIYDAAGNRLAFDMPAYNLDLYLPGIRSRGGGATRLLAGRLAPVVGANPSFLYKEFERKDVSWLRLYPYMVHVSLGVRDRVLQIFRGMGMQGDVNPYRTYRRVYPAGAFASQVVGFVDSQGSGAAGVEYEYNQYLKGSPGFQVFTQGNGGNPIPFRPVTTVPVQNGDSVYLTINPAIQHYADQALAIVKQRFSPAHAAIIVEDPNTGAILAMATLPHFNPNDYWNYPSSTLDTNWAISAPFEPGSTYKVFTLTGALATHSITLNQTYLSGVDVVNGVPIHDWNWYGWGRITYRQAMINSSNTGFIHIGQAEGVRNFYTYFDRFGLNRPTGIDLPGEGSSIIFNPRNLNPVDFATMTFGQGLAVTPIQQAAGVGAVANGGDLMKPYVVQKIVAPDGRIVYDRKPEVVRQVASRAIMNEITNVMIQDVNQDPLGKVNIPGYNIAGKTGTANIPRPGGGYIPHKYNLSFVGFVPAHHPALLIYATVSEPHNVIQYGDWVASPAARYVLRRSLAYLRIPPHGEGPASPVAGVPTGAYAVVPNVLGDTVSAAKAALTKSRLSAAQVRGGEQVVREWPAPGTRMAYGAKVVIAGNGALAGGGEVTVPRFQGMSMAEAVSVCEMLGLQMRLQGDGFAAWQSLPPGSRVSPGAVLSLRFQPIRAGA